MDTLNGVVLEKYLSYNHTLCKCLVSHSQLFIPFLWHFYFLWMRKENGWNFPRILSLKRLTTSPEVEWWSWRWNSSSKICICKKSLNSFKQQQFRLGQRSNVWKLDRNSPKRFRNSIKASLNSSKSKTAALPDNKRSVKPIKGLCKGSAESCSVLTYALDIHLRQPTEKKL